MKNEAEIFVGDDSYLKHPKWSITPDDWFPGVSGQADYLFKNLDIPDHEKTTGLDIRMVDGCTALEMELTVAAKVFAMTFTDENALTLGNYTGCLIQKLPFY